MDPEPALLSISDNNFLSLEERNAESLLQQEDSFVMNGPSAAVLGLTIAIATVAVPLFAVMSVRPFGGDSGPKTSVIERNGSKPPFPVSITRVSQSGS